jgi:hypothetical protein
MLTVYYRTCTMVGYFMSFIRDFPPDTVNMTTVGVITTGRALCLHNMLSVYVCYSGTRDWRFPGEIWSLACIVGRRVWAWIKIRSLVW